MQKQHTGLTEAQHRELAETLRRISAEVSMVTQTLEQAYGRNSKVFRSGFTIDVALGDLKEELAGHLAREWSKADGSTGVETIVKARGFYERAV